MPLAHAASPCRVGKGQCTLSERQAGEPGGWDAVRPATALRRTNPTPRLTARPRPVRCTYPTWLHHLRGHRRVTPATVLRWHHHGARGIARTRGLGHVAVVRLTNDQVLENATG